MGKDFVHVHVSDKERILPGECRVDWIGFMKAHMEINFNGFVTMEIGLDSRSSDPDQIARSGLNYLKEVVSKLQGGVKR